MKLIYEKCLEVMQSMIVNTDENHKIIRKYYY